MRKFDPFRALTILVLGALVIWVSIILGNTFLGLAW